MNLSWRLQARDLLECVLLPATIALLPYRLGLAVARAASRLPLYRDYVQGFAEGAARHGKADDPDALRRRRRFYVLVEHVDLYWARWRGDRFVRGHIDVRGAWPDDGTPFIAVFYHWGNGLFAVRHLALAGYTAHLVLRPVDDVQLGHRPIQVWYGRARAAAAAAAGGAPIIFWGGAKARIAAALDTPWHAVLGMVDVPPSETHTLTPVTLLGKPTAFTHGLVQIARERGLRLVCMHLGFDAALRRRVLEIEAPIDPARVELPVLMQQLADRIDARIDQDPAAWWLWAWVDQFFVGQAPPASPPVEPT